MIRIFSRAVLICAVIFLSISFSKANYFDSEASNENLFNAGTLMISDAGTTLVPFNFGSLHPGDHVTKTINLKNSGSIDISGLTVSAVNQTGDTGLLEQIQITAVSGTTYFTDSSSKISPWMTNANILNGVITPDQTYILEFSFDVPATISTVWEGKSVNFDIQIRAEQ